MEALCDMTFEKFQQKRVKLNSEDKYNETACQQHLLSAATYMNYTSVVKDLLSKGYRPDVLNVEIHLFASPLYQAAR